MPALIVLCLAMFGLALAAGIRADAPRVFFSGDEGLKSVQRRAFSQGSEQLMDPSAALAAAAPLTPWRRPFVQPCGHGLCSVWRNPVVRLGGLFERWGGSLFAATVAWCGLAVWLFATAVLATYMGAPPVWTAAALLFCTPAWLYGIVVWEHAPAAAMTTAALAWALRPRPPGTTSSRLSWAAPAFSAVLGAGVALAILSRPESGLMVVVAGVLALRQRRKSELAALACGLLLTLGVATFFGAGFGAWLSNNTDFAAQQLGSALRRHVYAAITMLGGLRSGGAALSLAGLPLIGLPLAGLPLAKLPLAAVVAGAAAGLMVLARWLPARLCRLGVAVVLAASLVSLVTLYAAPLAQVIGLVLIAPVVFVGLILGLRLDSSLTPVSSSSVSSSSVSSSSVSVPATSIHSSRRLLTLLTLLTLVLAIGFAPNDGGSQWGPRYLLPWLAPGLVLALSARPDWRRLVHAALLIGCFAQLLGVRHLVQQQGDKAAAMRWLLASPAKTLIAQAWYTPQELAGLALDHQWRMGLAADLPALRAAVSGLQRRKERAWIFAADPRLNAAAFLQRGGRWRVLGSRDVAFPPVQVRLHLVIRARQPGS